MGIFEIFFVRNILSYFDIQVVDEYVQKLLDRLIRENLENSEKLMVFQVFVKFYKVFLELNYVSFFLEVLKCLMYGSIFYFLNLIISMFYYVSIDKEKFGLIKNYFLCLNFGFL